MLKCIIYMCLIGLLTSKMLFGERTIWYVHPDSGLNSIQAALDSCSNNDIVLVAPSVYYEHIVWPNTQSIHLISELGPDTTIIDGSGSGRVIEITTSVDATTIIGGFTIQDGHANIGGGLYLFNASPTITDNRIIGCYAMTAGGGIACDSSSSPSIEDNTIDTNWALGWGAGIWCNHASPFITGNIINGNSTGDYVGGGIYCYESSPTIVNNEITNNYTDGIHQEGRSGGGIYCSGGSVTIISNTISHNRASWSISGYGGGICCHHASATIIDNAITYNIGFHGGGIYCLGYAQSINDNTITSNFAYGRGGGICLRESAPTISNDTIIGNSADPLSGGGVDCGDNSSPIINNCLIEANTSDGICCSGGANPTINYNFIIQNSGYGVLNLDPQVLINAEYNYWGDPSGPGGVGPGIGDEVSDYVDYDPWSTFVEERKSMSNTFYPHLLIQPNPFSTRVMINYHLPRTTHITLKIYDISGSLIKTLVDGRQAAQEYSVHWAGKHDNGTEVPAGVYFCRLIAGDFITTQKVLFVR